MIQSGLASAAIVDDDPDVLESMRFLLDLEGVSVSVYASAAAFLAGTGHQHSCLILDHHMPHMTGLELASQLRRDGVLIPILLVTGAPAPSIIARAAELGIAKVLEKPPTANELLDFVRRHTEGEVC